MAVTIRDVARKLNLSITTVSRALDGYDDVSEETRQRVIRAARELGYQPNTAARQLRRRRADAIGYILPSLTPRFTDPFFSEFIAGLGDETARRGFDLLVSSAPFGSELEDSSYHRWIQANKVDGFILNRLRRNDQRVNWLLKNKVSFATLERASEDHAWVEVDGQTAMARLVAHLAEVGHNRIAFIGALDEELVIHIQRLAGFRQGLQAQGLSFHPEYVQPGYMSRQGGYRAAKRLLALEKPPTALVCINDLSALGALRAAQEAGLQVGRELAVTGFDGIDESAHSTPPLTTIDQPVYEIARHLVRLVVAQINGDESVEQQIRLEPRLVVRASSEAGPGPFPKKPPGN